MTEHYCKGCAMRELEIAGLQDRLKLKENQLSVMAKEVDRLAKLVPKKEGVTMSLVRQVWSEYLAIHEIKKGKAFKGQLSPARIRLIKKAIAVHGVENCKRACAGVFIHEWSSNHNTTLEWALRMNQETDNVEKHAECVGYKKLDGLRMADERQAVLT